MESKINEDGGLGMMKVLVIGQGGREHAIVKALSLSPKVEAVYCAPGNGGIQSDAICVNIQVNEFEALTELVVNEEIDFTVVGPENPLLDGIVDFFQKKGLAIIGPTMQAAKIEGSKSFAKEIMKKYGIPTGDYQVFNEQEAAISYMEKQGVPIVIKADGLAAGKGVTVAFDKKQAIQAIQEIMAERVFGDAGNQIVIEEYLSGEELTVMAFVDGDYVLPMEPAQDHKPVYDGDKGPNTGGMGSYSPVPHMNQIILDEIYATILKPTALALVEEGIPFHGILYAGIILTNEGPKVIEFNARFGDPETQVVLPRLETDIVDIFQAMLNHNLQNIRVEWKSDQAVCVIMASDGYPSAYRKGLPIKIDELPKGTDIYIAGAQKENNTLFTSGGRVLGVTALAPTVKEAQQLAYQGIKNISFDGAHFRKDIANKAIKV